MIDIREHGGSYVGTASDRVTPTLLDSSGKIIKGVDDLGNRYYFKIDNKTYGIINNDGILVKEVTVSGNHVVKDINKDGYVINENGTHWFYTHEGVRTRWFNINATILSYPYSYRDTDETIANSKGQFAQLYNMSGVLLNSLNGGGGYSFYNPMLNANNTFINPLSLASPNQGQLYKIGINNVNSTIINEIGIYLDIVLGLNFYNGVGLE